MVFGDEERTRRARFIILRKQTLCVCVCVYSFCVAHTHKNIYMRAGPPKDFRRISFRKSLRQHIQRGGGGGGYKGPFSLVHKFSFFFSFCVKSKKENIYYIRAHRPFVFVFCSLSRCMRRLCHTHIYTRRRVCHRDILHEIYTREQQQQQHPIPSLFCM